MISALASACVSSNKCRSLRIVLHLSAALRTTVGTRVNITAGRRAAAQGWQLTTGRCPQAPPRPQSCRLAPLFFLPAGCELGFTGVTAGPSGPPPALWRSRQKDQLPGDQLASTAEERHRAGWGERAAAAAAQASGRGLPAHGLRSARRSSVAPGACTCRGAMQTRRITHPPAPAHAASCCVTWNQRLLGFSRSLPASGHWHSSVREDGGGTCSSQSCSIPHACTHMRACRDKHAHTHACMHAHAHTHAHTCTYMHTHAHSHTCTQTPSSPDPTHPSGIPEVDDSEKPSLSCAHGLLSRGWYLCSTVPRLGLPYSTLCHCFHIMRELFQGSNCLVILWVRARHITGIQ